MVDFTLEKEYERSVAEKKKSDNVVSMTVRNLLITKLIFAHAIEDASDEDKAYDEDIMDDENF